MSGKDSFGIRLTLKIGVSRCVGVFWEEGRRIRAIRTFPMEDEGSDLPFAHLSRWLEKEGTPAQVFLSSVNPAWTKSFQRYFRERGSLGVILFSPEKFPYPIVYDPPESMGSDRLLSVLGAIDRFPDLLEQSFAVVDFGSHTTVTIFHQKAVIGGSIAPGLSLSLGAIGGGRVSLGNPARKLRPEILSFPGNSTESAILAGTVLSAVRGLEGLLSDGEVFLKTSFHTLLTGGLSPVVSPMFRRSCRLDRHLLHRGAIRFLPEEKSV